MITAHTREFAYLAGQPLADPAKKNLLLIHGAGQNSRFWEHQVEGLAPHINTYALDLPGHGRSQGPTRQSIADMAHAVLEFMDAMGLTSVIPCGISMGGAIVLQLLIENPNTFPEGILTNTGARLKVLPDILDTVKNNYATYMTALFHMAIPADKRTKETKKALLNTLETDYRITYSDLMACNAFDVMTRLSTIESRVLVMAAEKDLSTPLKYGRLLSDRIENASFALINGCGHFSPIEDPEAFNKAVMSFL